MSLLLVTESLVIATAKIVKGLYTLDSYKKITAGGRNAELLEARKSLSEYTGLSRSTRLVMW